MRPTLICALLLTAGIPMASGGTNGVLSLSHYDEIAVNYPGLRREGVDAIIHEATYPVQTDARYSGRQGAAARAGMLWGAYHFGNATDGARQADRFLDFVGSSNRSQAPGTGVLLILDAEQNTHYPGGTMQVRHAVDFIRRVHQRTGIYPGLYSNENWVKRLFNSPGIDASSKETIKKCCLWIANYHYRPVATSPWPSWMFWQYTGDGICELPRASFPTSAGGHRKIERTIFSGSREAMKNFWNANAWKP